MRFNPCGMVTDWMTQPYRTVVRPFRDSDIQVGVRYFWAAPGALPLPGWNSFTSRNWLEFHEQEYDLGEVADAPRSNYTPEKTNGATGQKPCGPLDYFLNGQPYDPSVKPTVYNQYGIPECCLIVIAAKAASQLSPHSIYASHTPNTAHACSEGSPTSLYAGSVVNLVVGCSVGSPASVWGPDGRWAGSGCSEGSPASTWLVVPIQPGTAASQGSPASTWLVVPIQPGTAASQGSPASTWSTVGTYQGRGCSQCSPASQYGLPPGYQGEACTVCSPHSTFGAVAVQPAKAASQISPHSTFGAVAVQPAKAASQSSPHSVTSYKPPGPTPGATCATAGVIAMGTAYSDTLAGPQQSDWWMLPGVNSNEVVYVSQIGPTGAAGASFTAYVGASCTSQNSQAVLTLHAGCYKITIFGTGNLWFKWYTSSGNGVPYTFTVSQASC